MSGFTAIWDPVEHQASLECLRHWKLSFIFQAPVSLSCWNLLTDFHAIEPILPLEN